MIRFDGFSDDESLFLLRLPVRVGFWLSQVDLVGGAMAEKAERAAIKQIIVMYSSDYVESDFIQKVTQQLITVEHDWPNWMVRLSEIPDECRRAMVLLSGRIMACDFDLYKLHLLDVALAVAMAYGENENIKKSAPIVRFLKTLVGGFKTATPDERISISEYTALKELAMILGISSNILNSGV